MTTKTTKIEVEDWEWHQLITIHQMEATSLASSRKYDEAHAHESRAKEIKEMLNAR